MSECVVRMEMPKNRCPVRFSIAANGYCPIEDRSGCGFDVTKERPDWCPIICELPEKHGDLIERAATMHAILGEPTDAHYPSWYAEIVNDIQTIVPAERSEKDGR